MRSVNSFGRDVLLVCLQTNQVPINLKDFSDKGGNNNGSIEGGMRRARAVAGDDR